jgi:lysozyme family protein
MAAFIYDEALCQLLLHEGGYTDHPSDPGGPTNFGITIVDYRKYVKPGAIAADVKTMSLDEAKSIYRAKYWDAQRCDELPAGVDYAVFDYGVNSGIGRSKKVLQRVLGVAADGVFGAETMVAVAVCDPKATIVAICDERLRFLKGLKTWGVFGKGWGRRVADVKAFSLQLAGQKPTSVPKRALGAQRAGKGIVPVAKAAQQGSAGAVAAAGAAAAGQANASGVGAGGVVAIAAVAIVATTAAYAFWRWRQRRQQEAVA